MISVMVVCKNSMPYLTRCVASIHAQSMPGTEIIVVDRDSRDGTAAFLAQQARIRVVQQQSDGLALARNEAIANSHEPYLAFLDSDDEWQPSKLEKQLAWLQQQPQCDFVACLLQKVRCQQCSTPLVAMTPSGCLFRRSVFEKLGKFDPKYTIGCDHEWFIRAQRRNARFCILPEVLLTKHIHQNNLSLNLQKHRSELMRILRKHS